MKGIIGIGQHEPGKVTILDGFTAVECDHGIPLTQECKDCELARMKAECEEIVRKAYASTD